MTLSLPKKRKKIEIQGTLERPVKMHLSHQRLNLENRMKKKTTVHNNVVQIILSIRLRILLTTCYFEED